ncbi:MAG TPA: hypothetical protein VJR71_07825 [Pseudolabrys sp.]|nr:hypothetical protein [Pseudolabrys sp.]
MRRTFAILAVAVLVSVGIVKLAFTPTTTIAGTNSNAAAQTAVSIYDLDVQYPGMKALPVEQAPMP